MSNKPELSFEERIKAAYLHYVTGVEQQALAVAFEVNGGRINEACIALELAARYPKEIRKLWDANAKKSGKAKARNRKTVKGKKP